MGSLGLCGTPLAAGDAVTGTNAHVLLVNSPIARAQRDGPLGPVIRNLYFNSPPLGIACLAAVLERENVPVELVDAAVEDLSAEE